MKDLFQKSLKIEEKSGSKELFKEVLDVKAFADNVQALRKNENLLKYFYKLKSEVEFVVVMNV